MPDVDNQAYDEIQKRCEKGARGYKIELLTDILDKLVCGEQLPARNHDHPLTGNLLGCRECHIAPDWLLIYEIDEPNEILYLLRTGTHSDLFQI